MNWFRTASANCQRDWQAALEQAGFKVGVANPALIYNAEECCRGGVDGDDFVVVGWARPYLANTPCENRTDLALGITVNATLSC